MKKFDMENFEGSELGGDCFRCCVAMMLSRFDPALELADVPHFYGIYGRQGEPKAREFVSERGLAWRSPMLIPGMVSGDGASVMATLNRYMSDGLPWIASGPSPRNDQILHCVVMVGHEMFHDPHPDRAGCWGIYDATFIERSF